MLSGSSLICPTLSRSRPVFVSLLNNVFSGTTYPIEAKLCNYHLQKVSRCIKGGRLGTRSSLPAVIKWQFWLLLLLLDAEMKFRHLSCSVPLRVFLFVCLSVCLFVCLWYDFLQGPKTDLYETSGHDRGPSK